VPRPAATSRIPATPVPQVAAPSAPVNATVVRSSTAPSSPNPTPKTPKYGDAPTPAKAPAPTPASKPAKPTPNFKLPGAVYSPQLLESVIFDLQNYLDWIRQNQIRKQVGAHTKDEPNHSDETVLVIEAWLSGKPATLETIEALLAYLRGLKLPQVHIMLAALPNRTQRLALVDWFRNNATPELLLSFVADRNLGGGIVVRTPNHVFDFSWKQELVAGRAKLAEILKRV
jgi:hypothetical protein